MIQRTQGNASIYGDPTSYQEQVKAFTYPQDFIDRCIAAFPVWKKLHDALHANSLDVDRMLSDFSPSSLPLDLEESARRKTAAIALYNEWKTFVPTRYGPRPPKTARH